MTRTPEQVAAAARAMDRARAAGLPDEVLAALLQLRDTRAGLAPMPTREAVMRVVGDPRARAVDAVLVAWARQRIAPRR